MSRFIAWLRNRVPALAACVLALLVGGIVVWAGGAAAHPQNGTAGIFSSYAGHSRTTIVAYFEAPETDRTLFSATINWGDGSPASSGSVGGGADSDGDGLANFAVTGTHAYATAGTYEFSVLILDAHSEITVKGTATITTVPPVTTARDVSAIAGQSVTAVVADIETFEDTATYGITVDWGDGSPPSPGTVTSIGNPDGDETPNYEVKGTHTYAVPGSYTFTVTVNRGGGGPVDQPGVVDQVQGTATVVSPDVKIDASFAILPGRNLLFGAPALFTASGAVTPASAGPLTFEWDFGEGREWTDSQLADPAAAGAFPPNPPAGAYVTHAFAPKQGESPATFAPDNRLLRATFLVRLKASDRFGRSKVVGRTVAVMPDRAPVADFTWRTRQRGAAPAKPAEGDVTTEYTREHTFTSTSYDPDAGEPYHDQIIREEWDLDGRGGFEIVTDKVAGDHHYTHWIRRLGGRPPLSELKFPHPMPTRYLPAPKKITPGTNVEQQGLLDLAHNNANAKALRDKAHVDDTAGPIHSGPRTVRLRVTDRSGRTDTREQVVPMRRRLTPRADAYISNAEPGVSNPECSSEGCVLWDPVYVDTTPYKGDGTLLRFDVGPSVPDPKGRILYYVLEVGRPWTKSTTCRGQGPGQQRIPEIPPEPGPGAGAARAAATEKPPKASPGGAQTAKPWEVKCREKTEIGVDDIVKTLVFSNPDDATLTIPKKRADGEPWSILISAIDETGAVGKTRFDGLEVVEQDAGTCQNLSRNLSGGRVRFTGTCVYAAKRKGGGSLYWTRNPIDLSGQQLAAPDGHWIVLDAGPGADGVYATSVQPDPKTWSAGAVKPEHRSKLTILLDDRSLADIPWSLQGENLGDSHPVSLKPPGGSALKPPHTITVNAAGSARYKGLAVDGQVMLRLLPPKGDGPARSRLEFDASLPSVFGANTVHASIPGANQGKKTVLKKTIQPAAKAAARAAVILAKRRSTRSRARAAAAGAPSLESVGPLNLGGFPLGNGVVTFKYHPGTDTFRGTAEHVEIIPGSYADVTIVLADGAFDHASGTLTLPGEGAPVAPGVNLKSFGFTVRASPNVQLEGDARLQTTGGGLLTADGKLTMGFDPWSVDIVAKAKVANLLEFGKATLKIRQNQLAFTGQMGKDFGPASIEAKVSGVFGLGGFNLEGAGEACLFVCLDIRGLVSSVGVAACGSIEITMPPGIPNITIDAGFGNRWAPPELDVFVGSCSLSPYRVSIAPNTHARTMLPRQQGTAKPPLVAGQEKTFVLTRPASALAVVTKTHQGAQFPEGTVPRVSLITPTGAELAATSPILGQVRQIPDKGVLVDQDTIAGETRFLIGDPQRHCPQPPCSWRLRVNAGSPPVTAIDTETTELPVSKDRFKSVTVKDLKDPKSKVLYGTVNANLYGIDNAKPPKATPPSKLIVAPSSPKVRTSAIKKHLPTKRLHFESHAGQMVPGDRVTFVETGPLTSQIIATVVVPADGTLNGHLDFAAAREPDGHLEPLDHPDRPWKGPWKGMHRIAAYVANDRGLLRGTIPNLAEFPAPKPDVTPADIVDLLRDPTRRLLKVLVDEGRSLPGGPLAMYRLVVRTSSGKRASFGVTPKRLRRVAAGSSRARAGAARATAKRKKARVRRRWGIVLRGIPAGDKVTVKLYGIRPPGSRRKVRLEQATLRAHARSLKHKPRSRSTGGRGRRR